MHESKVHMRGLSQNTEWFARQRNVSSCLLRGVRTTQVAHTQALVNDRSQTNKQKQECRIFHRSRSIFRLLLSLPTLECPLVVAAFHLFPHCKELRGKDIYRQDISWRLRGFALGVLIKTPPSSPSLDRYNVPIHRERERGRGARVPHSEISQ